MVAPDLGTAAPRLRREPIARNDLPPRPEILVSATRAQPPCLRSHLRGFSGLIGLGRIWESHLGIFVRLVVEPDHRHSASAVLLRPEQPEKPSGCSRFIRWSRRFRKFPRQSNSGSVNGSAWVKVSGTSVDAPDNRLPYILDWPAFFDRGQDDNANLEPIDTYSNRSSPSELHFA